MCAMSTQTSMMMISHGSLPMALKEGSSLMRAGCAPAGVRMPVETAPPPIYHCPRP